MSDYTKITNFTIKDTLPEGEAEKLVLGEEIDDELDAIAVAIASKTELSAVSRAYVGGLLWDRTAAEISATVTPSVEYYPPGVMPRYSTLADAIAQLEAGGAIVELERGATYTISSTITLEGLSNFVIRGNGATIKAEDGMSVGSGTQLLKINDCHHFRIHDLFFDGNRDNRTPAETSSHLMHFTSCTNGIIQGCRADNATTDGFRFDATDVTDFDSFCRNILMIGCSANNAYRLGMSGINGHDITVIGCSFTGSNGVSPEAGVDIESNEGTTVDPGNRSWRFYGCKFTDNQGYQLVLSGKDNSRHLVVNGCYFSEGDATADSSGGISVSGQAIIESCEFEGFTKASAMGIDVASSSAARVTVDKCTFRNFGSSAGSCIDDGSATASLEVTGCKFFSVVTACTSDGDRLVFDRNEIVTASGVGVSVTGDEALIRSNRIVGATGRGIFCTGSSIEISGNWVVDVGTVVGAYIQAEGTGNVIFGNVCSATVAATSTLAIRAHFDATFNAHNRAINLHSTQPFTRPSGSEATTNGQFGPNIGGTANFGRRVGNAFGVPALTTGNRPSASAIPAGTSVWDSTLKKPVWSDGTNFYDATGTLA